MTQWYDEKTGSVQNRDETSDLGGTMRLGAYPCRLRPDSVAHKAYRTEQIAERHRHRYEFNNQYRQTLEKNGLIVSGISPDETLVEIVELKVHPWFLGCQFHPEFKSRPMHPHPLFQSFIRAAKEYARNGKKVTAEATDCAPAG
jgi:CTP synthase